MAELGEVSVVRLTDAVVSVVQLFGMLCLSQPVDCPVEKDSGALLSAQTITSETISTTTTTQITKVCSVFIQVMVRLQNRGSIKGPR